jgi:hypothetical protein
MTKTFAARVRIAAAGLALIAVSACTQTFNAKVKRFQAELPATAGQTYAVVADDAALAGGIEFGQYARLVDAQMAKLGYLPSDPTHAQMLVRFDYGVDKGHERVTTTGFRGDPFWNPWFGYGRGGYYGGSRGGYYGRPYGMGPHGMWGYGWYDPWFDSGYDSETVYTSGVTLKIDRKDDGKRLFEGKAEAASTSNRLQYLVPNLVEALFTDFPGHNGETVRISVAPEKKK